MYISIEPTRCIQFYAPTQVWRKELRLFPAVIHAWSCMRKVNHVGIGFLWLFHGYWAGRVYDLCVYHMTGTPEGSAESGFKKKSGIEPRRDRRHKSFLLDSVNEN